MTDDTTNGNSRVFGNYYGGFGPSAGGNWGLFSDHEDHVRYLTFWSDNFYGTILKSSTVMSLNTWYHVAVTRSGNTLRIFINGTLEDSLTTSVAIDDGTINRIDIGGNGGGHNFIGYIDEARITKGVARYTSNFTPQTREFYPGDYVISGNTNIADGDWHQIYATYEPISTYDSDFENVVLLLPFTGEDGSTSFIDYSTRQKTPSVIAGNVEISTDKSKFGNGSFYSPDCSYSAVNSSYLRYPINPDYSLSGDFTLEFWVNTDCANLTNSMVVRTGDYSSNCPAFVLTGRPRICVNGINAAAGNIITGCADQWVHVAYVRNNGVIKIYTDGCGQSDYNYSCTFYNAYFEIGRTFCGYLNDLRFTKGVARYTADFTPPTAPLPTGNCSTTKLYVDGYYEGSFTNTNSNYPCCLNSSNPRPRIAGYNMGKVD
jgi:hypothetical protein